MSAQKYRDLKRQMENVSDTAVALVLLADEVAELTKVVKNKIVAFDGEQVGLIRESFKEIAISLHGVGQMVENSQQ